MRYYTKEWRRLLDQIGNAEMYEAVLDKKYTDEEIQNFYDDKLEYYMDEERISYEELFNMPAGAGGEDSGSITVGIEVDDETLRAEFEEDYQELVNEPDKDLPEWVRESVDPRLLALYLMPESVHKKLTFDEAKLETEFDRLDDAAETALEAAQKLIPEEYGDILEKFDDLEGAYVAGFSRSEGRAELIFSDWDDEGEPVKEALVFTDPEVIEDEGLDIKTGYDEDGDFESNCELDSHEVYYEGGSFEIHMMFDIDDEYKYLTLRCKDFSIAG